MKTFLLSLARTLLQGAIEVLLYVPLLLLVAVYGLSGINVWGWMVSLPILFTAGYVIHRLLPWSKLYLPYGIAIVLGIAHTLLVVGLEIPLWWLSVPIASLVAFRGSRLTEEEWHLYFPSGFYIVGMVLYGILSLVGSHMEAIAPYMPVLLWGGLFALAVTMLMVNQSNVKQEAYATVKNTALSVAVIWQNRLFVLVLFAAVIIAASLQAIERGIAWLFKLILYLILAIVALFATSSSEFPDSRDGVRPIPELGKGGDPAWWWELLQRIGIYISYVLIAIVAIIMTYIVVKRLIKFAKWLYRWFLNLISSRGSYGDGGAYVDDVETIVSWNELGDRWAAGLSQWFRRDKGVSWGELTDNRERIRFLYRNLLLRTTRRGYGFKPHLTPAETELDLKRWSPSSVAGEEGGLVKLYERVRYGDDTISDEEVAQAKAAADKR